MTSLFKSICAAALMTFAAPVGAAAVLDPAPFSALAPITTGSVHSDGTQSGDGSVFGVTVSSDPTQNGVRYSFTSPSNLSTTGSGVAVIEGPFSQLTVSRDGGGLFSAIDFNLQVAGITRSNPFFATAMVVFADNTTQFLDLGSLGNGVNRYLVYSADPSSLNQLFRSITFNGYSNSAHTIAANFTDIRQVGVITAIPEPASWMLMILGIGVVGTSMRSRRRFEKAIAA